MVDSQGRTRSLSARQARNSCANPTIHEASGRRGLYPKEVQQRPQRQPSLRPTNFVAQIPDDTKHRFSREFATGQSAAAIDGVRRGWSREHLPWLCCWTRCETPHGEGGAQSFPGHLHCITGHELAAVQVLGPVMPHQSPLRIAAGDRGLDDHRVHGGWCHVEPLRNVGDVLFPLVLPQGCQDLRGVPCRRDAFFNEIDAPSLFEAMVDYGPSQVRTVLDGFDDRELTAVVEAVEDGPDLA